MSARYCAGCGARMPEGGHFCTGCGRSAAGGKLLQETTPASQTSVQPTTMSPPAPPDAPPQPGPPTIEAPPPQQTGGGRLFKGLLGGLGLVCVLAVGVVLYTFLYPDPGQTYCCGEPEPVDHGSAVPNPPPEQGPIGEAGLEGLVRQGGGDFELLQVEKDPESVSRWGATEALKMFYRTPEGGQLGHFLTSYSSPEEAERARQEVVEWMVSDLGYKVAEDIPFENTQGELYGTGVRLRQGEEEVWQWTNGALLCSVAGSPDSTVDFMNTSEY
jgi:hypothetical protein